MGAYPVCFCGYWLYDLVISHKALPVLLPYNAEARVKRGDTSGTVNMSENNTTTLQALLQFALPLGTTLVARAGHHHQLGGDGAGAAPGVP